MIASVRCFPFVVRRGLEDKKAYHVYRPNEELFVLVILTYGNRPENEAYALVSSLAKIIYDDWIQ
jgi:hypothetical protein